jgi:hypothetical protein
VDTLVVADDADALDEHEVLAVVVLVRHSSRSGAEVHGEGVEARQDAWQFLHAYVVRVVEQGPQRFWYRFSRCLCSGAEFVHDLSGGIGFRMWANAVTFVSGSRSDS